MPLAKEIEFPLFSIGRYTSRDGTAVNFTEPLLRQMERNSNFAIQTRVLQPPVSYDHPARNTDNHATLVSTRYKDGVLYVKANNWSDALVKDVKNQRRIAYSGEFDEKFTYNEVGTGKPVTLGPTVIGVAMLGSKRPAIKNLKPPKDFEFAEDVSAVDQWMIRRELEAAHVTAYGSEGSHCFAEVENNSERFFSEEGDEMDEKEIKKLIRDAVDENDAKWKGLLDTQKKEFTEAIAANTVGAKRKEEVHEFCETIAGDKKANKTQLGKLDAILMHPSVANNKELDGLVRSFAEAASPIMLGRDVARKKKVDDKPAKKKGEFAEVDTDDDDEQGDDEGSALDALTPKTFAEFQRTTEGEKVINEALREFSETYPNKVRGQNYTQRLDALGRFIKQRATEGDD